MAWQEKFPGSDVTAMASTNVSTVSWTADQYGNLTYSSGGIQFGCAVEQDTGTGNPLDVILVSGPAAAQIPLGIAQNWPAAGPGQSVRVQVMGDTKALASAAVTVGQLVYVADSSGRLGPAPAPGATNSYIVGVALTAAAEVNDLFTVRLMLGAATQVSA